MVIKMEKIRLEKQGRILIPKHIRDTLKLRAGEELNLEMKDNQLILRMPLSAHDFIVHLKGCVKKSKIHPLELKKMWGM